MRNAADMDDTLARLTALLRTPDGDDLRGRGHHLTCPGHPQRRHLALKPLLVRWMVIRLIETDPSESSVGRIVRMPSARAPIGMVKGGAR